MTDHNDRDDRLADLLQQSGPRPVPAGDRFDRARAAARDAWQVELRRAARRRNRLLTVAGAAAAMLALAVASYRIVTRPRAVGPIAMVEAGTLRAGETLLRPGDRVPRGVTIRTGADARATLRMDSGVELRLDVETVGSLPGAAIVALDRGAVFLDTGITQHAVSVRTPAGVARDIGTRFEVRIVGGATRVRVRDGQVQFDVRGVTHTADAGVELVADDGGVARHRIDVAGSDWSWIALATAPFNADGQTLAAFLAWVSKEGGLTIRFADEALRQSASTIVIRGSIDGLTPRQALETIVPTCGLTHRIDGSIVTLDRMSGR